ncbi:MAG: hypothetical protein Ct9H90mP28_4560 [Paracoccaceae bacterium]|nr:MAG: hypothetical protein Ct9H90mP28_4560 [Paracoccaceae bacterium]
MKISTIWRPESTPWTSVSMRNKGDEESEKSEDTEDEAAAKKRAEMIRRIREDIIWSPQQKK